MGGREESGGGVEGGGVRSGLVHHGDILVWIDGYETQREDALEIAHGVLQGRWRQSVGARGRAGEEDGSDEDVEERRIGLVARRHSVATSLHYGSLHAGARQSTFQVRGAVAFGTLLVRSTNGILRFRRWLQRFFVLDAHTRTWQRFHSMAEFLQDGEEAGEAGAEAAARSFPRVTRLDDVQYVEELDRSGASALLSAHDVGAREFRLVLKGGRGEVHLRAASAYECRAWTSGIALLIGQTGRPRDFKPRTSPWSPRECASVPLLTPASPSVGISVVEELSVGGDSVLRHGIGRSDPRPHRPHPAASTAAPPTSSSSALSPPLAPSAANNSSSSSIHGDGGDAATQTVVVLNSAHSMRIDRRKSDSDVIPGVTPTPPRPRTTSHAMSTTSQPQGGAPSTHPPEWTEEEEEVEEREAKEMPDVGRQDARMRQGSLSTNSLRASPRGGADAVLREQGAKEEEQGGRSGVQFEATTRRSIDAPPPSSSSRASSPASTPRRDQTLPSPTPGAPVPGPPLSIKFVRTTIRFRSEWNDAVSVSRKWSKAVYYVYGPHGVVGRTTPQSVHETVRVNSVLFSKLADAIRVAPRPSIGGKPPTTSTGTSGASSGPRRRAASSVVVALALATTPPPPHEPHLLFPLRDLSGADTEPAARSAFHQLGEDPTTSVEGGAWEGERFSFDAAMERVLAARRDRARLADVDRAAGAGGAGGSMSSILWPEGGLFPGDIILSIGTHGLDGASTPADAARLLSEELQRTARMVPGQAHWMEATVPITLVRPVRISTSSATPSPPREPPHHRDTQQPTPTPLESKRPTPPPAQRRERRRSTSRSPAEDRLVDEAPRAARPVAIPYPHPASAVTATTTISSPSVSRRSSMHSTTSSLHFRAAARPRAADHPLPSAVPPTESVAASTAASVAPPHQNGPGRRGSMDGVEVDFDAQLDAAEEEERNRTPPSPRPPSPRPPTHHTLGPSPPPFWQTPSSQAASARQTERLLSVDAAARLAEADAHHARMVHHLRDLDGISDLEQFKRASAERQTSSPNAVFRGHSAALTDALAALQLEAGYSSIDRIMADLELLLDAEPPIAVLHAPLSPLPPSPSSALPPPTSPPPVLHRPSQPVISARRPLPTPAARGARSTSPTRPPLTTPASAAPPPHTRGAEALRTVAIALRDAGHTDRSQLRALLRRIAHVSAGRAGRSAHHAGAHGPPRQTAE